MAGENGTSHMGNVYHYYKCGRAKRRGKEHCDLRAICKEPLVSLAYFGFAQRLSGQLYHL